MPLPSRIALLTASALFLAGCAATLPTAPQDAPAPTNVAAKKKRAEPVPIPYPTFDALKGRGLHYFDDNKASRFYVADRIARNGLYPVREEFKKGEPHGFTWGTGAASVLRKGNPLDPQAVVGLSVEPDHHVVIHFAGEKKRGAEKAHLDNDGLDLHLKLEAYDLSGLPIGPYLVTRTNRRTAAGYLIGNAYKFPRGSVGFRAVLWTDEDEVIVPTNTSFTGSDSIESFSARFAKEIPYCLRFIPSRTAEPIGFLFEEPIRKKTVRDGNGRSVEASQSGSVRLHSVKRGTIFCAREEERSRFKADWRLRYVNGSRVLEFDFPDRIASENFGVPAAHRNALSVAFAEVRTGKGRKVTKRLVPARVWHAQKPVTDYQWRFNDEAAEAVRAALEATKEKRADWEREREAKRNAARKGNIKQ